MKIDFPILDYNINVKKLIEQEEFLDESIFKLSEFTGNDEIEIMFSFYQGYINQNKYNTNPTIFYYNRNESINAFAGKGKYNFIISVNIGVYKYLHAIFKQNPHVLKNAEIKDIELINRKSDHSLNDLMFQLSNHFTYYHELGHIIQKSSLLDTRLNEAIVSSTGFNFERHILEYDADTFSAICLGTHLFQYYSKYYEDPNLIEIELFISAVVSGVYIYLLSFPSNNSDFYIKEKTHPHIIIRIINILNTIVDYISKISIIKSSFILTPQIIFDNMINITSIISDTHSIQYDISEFLQTLQTNKNEIQEYGNELTKGIQNLPNSAVRIWNETAKK